jgi:hypothetical protein
MIRGNAKSAETTQKAQKIMKMASLPIVFIDWNAMKNKAI